MSSESSQTGAAAPADASAGAAAPASRDAAGPPSIVSPVEPEPRYPRWALLPVGLGVAFVSSIAGIGGGLFAVPVLYMLWGLSLGRSVATSLVLVFANALASTLAEAFRSDSSIDWVVVGQAILGTLVGAQLGYAIAKRIDRRLLRWIFIVVLTIAGARMLFTLLFPAETGPNASLGFLLELGVPQFLFVGVIGLLGGVASPLLGIGGGLVVVPALFLCLPGLGFAGARASSLAIASISSARSLWLHAADRKVDAAAGLYLGGGALLGAALGVQAIHVPGVPAIGQGILVATLWIVAVRFVFELRATAKPPEDN